MTSLRYPALSLILWISTLQAQNPAIGGNTAWQMQQQQMQAQHMFQMQQQMQRNIQFQQQLMAQQRQLQQQMSAQQRAWRVQKEALLESAARHLIGVPPPLTEKPSKEAWTVVPGLSNLFPAFDGGTRLACLATRPLRVRGLNLSDGEALWEAPIAEKPALDPFFVGDSLIYATADQQLVVLNAASGKERRRIKLDALDAYFLSNRINHPSVLFPAIDGQRIVLATYGKGKGGPTGWIYSIDLTSWEIQWKQEFLGGPDLTPQIKGDRVLVGGGGRILALNLTDGKQVWECRLASSEEIKNGPILADRMVVVCDRKLQAIDLSRGDILWSAPYKGQFLPQGEGERVLFTEDRGWILPERWVVAVDSKTGKMAWELQLNNTRLPWIQDGKVLCNANETFMALDLSTGKQLWTQVMKTAPALPIAVFGDALYVVIREGRSSLLQALRLKDGSVAWDYTYPHKPSDGLVILTQKGFLISGDDPALVLVN